MQNAISFLRLIFFYIINIALFYILIELFFEIHNLMTPYLAIHLHDLENAMNAAAILLVSYGVVFEESEPIMKLFYLYPKYQNEFNKELDRLSHDSGLVCLIFGLFIQIPVQLIKVSDAVVNTTDIEIYLIYISSFFLIITCIALIIYTLKLSALIFRFFKQIM